MDSGPSLTCLSGIPEDPAAKLPIGTDINARVLAASSQTAHVASTPPVNEPAKPSDGSEKPAEDPVSPIPPVTGTTSAYAAIAETEN